MSASFLQRIAIRAGAAPSTMPSLMAKGLGGAPVMRAELPEEEGAPEVQRIARRITRAAAPPPAEPLPPEPEEKAPVQRLPARRLSTDPDAEKERAEEEELGPLLHRAAVPEPPEQPDKEPARRAAAPDPATLSPEDEQVPKALAHEPPPRDLRALRRDAAPPAAPAAAPAAAPMPPGGADAPFPVTPGPQTTAETGPAPSSPSMTAPALPPFLEGPLTPQAVTERPSVVIEQVEVLIHEPAAPARRMGGADRSRLVRARYLGRL